MMERRLFGRTGMRLSVLGFGCGAVGGLMVRGDPLDQERTVARAIDAGVNYFDTAVQYGNGESEKNLGRILQKLKPANVAVGTKVRIPSGDFHSISDVVTKSLEGWRGCAWSELTSFICTMQSRKPAAEKRPAFDKCSMTFCRYSSGCSSKARPVSSGLPQSATPRRCTK
jgi:Aldo/keto reductase family